MRRIGHRWVCPWLVLGPVITNIRKSGLGIQRDTATHVFHHPFLGVDEGPIVELMLGEIRLWNGGLGDHLADGLLQMNLHLRLRHGVRVVTVDMYRTEGSTRKRSKGG
jgi:hypothetical protein